VASGTATVAGAAADGGVGLVESCADAVIAEQTSIAAPDNGMASPPKYLFFANLIFIE
jgi:hypothetical protein